MTERHLMVLSAALSLLAAAIGHVQVGGATLHFYLAVASFCAALVYLAGRAKLTFPTFLIPLLALICVSVFRINNQFGALQTLYMLCPALYYLAARSSRVAEIRDDLGLNLNLLIWALLMLLGLHALFPFLNISSRAASIFAVVIALFCLFQRASRAKQVAAIIVALCVLLSGARGAFLAFVVSAGVGWTVRKFGIRGVLVTSALGAVVVLIAPRELAEAVFSIPALRERTFYDGQFDFDALRSLEFNTSGREIAWPYFLGVIEGGGPFQLFFGRGPGAAADLGTTYLGAGWAHPHNEILRVMIDYGLAGIVAFAVFWLFAIGRALKYYGESKSLICALGVLTIIVMLTDNPLVYALYFGNHVLWILGKYNLRPPMLRNSIGVRHAHALG